MYGAEFWNPTTHTYLFMAETRRMWELEQEQGVINLSSVQAATILGRIYFANGMDSMGWKTWTHAVAMADKLDLFNVKPHFSEKERISRTITAWGVFSQQAFSCFYLMKPPLSRLPPQDGLPNYQDAHDFFGEIWVKYPLADHLTPIHLGQTFLALNKLRYIMNDIAGKALPEKDGHDEIDIQQADRYHGMFMQWFNELPEPLQPHNIAMPTHLLLHMQFHNLITMTFQPFLKHEKSLNAFNNTDTFQQKARFSPKRLFAASKASLQTLLHMFYHRHGFEAYYIFLLQVLVQLGFDALERLRTLEAQQTHFPAVMKATRATLILCAKGLRDQGRNFFLSELIFRILRDEMNPVDVKLLKDWTRIKDEEQREQSMMEHVDSEYPVN
ncbi:EPT1, sn-1,2-diacylglycerol ethanolamine- and cholinephosphotransferase, partial [Pyrenophora tritici-repentis]